MQVVSTHVYALVQGANVSVHFCAVIWFGVRVIVVVCCIKVVFR